MRRAADALIRLALLAFVCYVFSLAAHAHLSSVPNLLVIVTGIWLTYPLVWLGRTVLDRHRTTGRAVWTTTLVHVGLGFTLGVPLVRALVTHGEWPGWVLPVPTGVGTALVIASGAASFLTVANLAVRGSGAPFFIVLSRRLAADWLYAWTRNPMVLAGLAFFVSLGIWFRSALFVVWVLAVFAPALLFFVKVFEERELEIRFGTPYLEYKSRTPMLLPHRPAGPKV